MNENSNRDPLYRNKHAGTPSDNSGKIAPNTRQASFKDLASSLHAYTPTARLQDVLTETTDTGVGEYDLSRSSFDHVDFHRNLEGTDGVDAKGTIDVDLVGSLTKYEHTPNPINSWKASEKETTEWLNDNQDGIKEFFKEIYGAELTGSEWSSARVEFRISADANEMPDDVVRRLEDETQIGYLQDDMNDYVDGSEGSFQQRIEGYLRGRRERQRANTRTDSFDHIKDEVIRNDLEKFNKHFAEKGALVTDKNGEIIGVDPTKVNKQILDSYTRMLKHGAATGKII